MFTYVVLIHSDPNNTNSIVYHLIIVKYSIKTLHWYFPWATALHLYNMTGTGGKLQQLHCYHPFSDFLDIYLTKNHYENYSPKMVPIANIWGSGSWTTTHGTEIRHLKDFFLEMKYAYIFNFILWFVFVKNERIKRKGNHEYYHH